MAVPLSLLLVLLASCTVQSLAPIRQLKKQLIHSDEVDENQDDTAMVESHSAASSRAIAAGVYNYPLKAASAATAVAATAYSVPYTAACQTVVDYLIDRNVFGGGNYMVGAFISAGTVYFTRSGGAAANGVPGAGLAAPGGVAVPVAVAHGAPFTAAETTQNAVVALALAGFTYVDPANANYQAYYNAYTQGLVPVPAAVMPAPLVGPGPHAPVNLAAINAANAHNAIVGIITAAQGAGMGLWLAAPPINNVPMFGTTARAGMTMSTRGNENGNPVGQCAGSKLSIYKAANGIAHGALTCMAESWKGGGGGVDVQDIDGAAINYLAGRGVGVPSCLTCQRSIRDLFY